MNVAQWSIIKSNAGPSGLKRYDFEILKECSKLIDVEQFSTRENRWKTLSYFGKNRGKVTHITTQQYALLQPILNVKNCVLTVHDLIQENFYSPKRKFKEFWYFCKASIPFFERYIVDSSYVKSELINKFRICEDKISVIPLGVDHEIFYPVEKEKARELLNLDKDKVYLLGISSGEPWKNTSLFNKLEGDFEILDGGYGRGKFGIVEENKLNLLYSACDIFLAPSFSEGFCLPVVESMACGVPCIVSNWTALPETVGSGGLCADPLNLEEWNTAIDKILKNKDSWKNKALMKAKEYSWEKTGVETVKVYNELL